MDLCGSMKTTTLGGACYIMLIIDDFSRKVWVYLLVEKSQASRPRHQRKFERSGPTMVESLSPKLSTAFALNEALLAIYT